MFELDSKLSQYIAAGVLTNTETKIESLDDNQECYCYCECKDLDTQRLKDEQASGFFSKLFFYYPKALFDSMIYGVTSRRSSIW